MKNFPFTFGTVFVFIHIRRGGTDYRKTERLSTETINNQHPCPDNRHPTAGTNDNHRQRHLTIYGQPLTTYNKLPMKDTTVNQHQQTTTDKG
jgi:hypothetical protein